MDNLYYSERRIIKKNAGSAPLHSEHHFFFNFSGLTDAVLETYNGNFPVCNLHFIGKSKDAKVHEASLNVEFANKAQADDNGKSESQNKEKEKKKSLKEVVDVRQHITDDARRYVFNPVPNQKIRLCKNNDFYVIEICNPSDLWGLPTRLNALWKATVEQAHVQDKFKNYLSIIALPTRCVEDVVIQRFEVRCDDVPPTFEQLILAKLRFTCEELAKHNVASERLLYILYDKNAVPKAEVHHSCALPPDHPSKKAQELKKAGYYNPYSYHTPLAKTYYQSARDSAKKKSKKFDYASEYSEVLLEDVDFTELTDNEQYELFVAEVRTVPQLLLGFDKNANSDQEGFLSFCRVHGYDPHDKDSIVDFHAHQAKFGHRHSFDIKDIGDKKKEGQNVESQKSGLIKNENLSEQESNRLGGSLIDRVAPCEIYSPTNNMTVTLERGQKLFVNMKISNKKIGDFRKPWIINPISTHPQFQIWIEKGEIITGGTIPFQQFEVRIMTIKRYEPIPNGEYNVGILRLQNGDDTVTVRLKLNIHSKSEIEHLSTWRTYFLSVKQSRPLSYGLKFEHYKNRYFDNRITLINPIGREFEIPISQNDECELILNPPYNREGGKNYTLNINVIGGGKIIEQDSSSWMLWNGDIVQRFLVKIKKHLENEKFYAELKLNYDGEDVGTRIMLYSGANQPKVVLPPKPPVITRCKKHPDRMMVSGWKNNSSLEISPTDYVHIQVPQIENLLGEELRSKITRTSWGAELIQNVIDDLIFSDLRLDGHCDKYSVWYPNDGLFTEATEPWNHYEYILPPLKKEQPFLVSILEQFKRLYGDKTSYCIGEVKFTCKVANEFEISQSLKLNVLNIAYEGKNKKHKQIDLIDFQNKKKITVENGDRLFIDLSGKWIQEKEYDVMSFIPWKLVSNPLWLIHLNSGKVVKDQTWTFIVQLPDFASSALGEVIFECDGEYKSLYLSVV